MRDRATRLDPTRETGQPLGTAAVAQGHGAEERLKYSNTRAMKHVRALARKIGTRVRAKPGEWKASKYVRERFESYGYETKIQRFSVDGGTSRNVIAWWPDAMRYGFVVGGHMDTVRRSQGANDNASGVAVMLEMARISANRELARFVRFIAFGAEEFERDAGSATSSNRWIST